jgi:hypothetical protein
MYLYINSEDCTNSLEDCKYNTAGSLVQHIYIRKNIGSSCISASQVAHIDSYKQ